MDHEFIKDDCHFSLHPSVRKNESRYRPDPGSLVEVFLKSQCLKIIRKNDHAIRTETLFIGANGVHGLPQS